jgi:hypothetical protein
VALPPEAAHLPGVRVGGDGPASAARFARLHPARSTHPVPAQRMVLLENEHGTPVLSVGFRGRGKVMHWGLRGLDQMGAERRSRTVGRLLRQMLAEAVRPLMPQGEAGAVYPALAATGRENVLLTTAQANAFRVGTEKELRAASGPAHRWARWRPGAPGMHRVRAGEGQWTAPAADNPGREQVHFEFQPQVLRAFAERAEGRHLRLREAAEGLSDLERESWRRRTATRYPLADSVWLLLAIAAVGALHWILRKWAGLAI